MTRSPNRRMIWRLWLRAVTVKRPQAIVSAISLLVGAAIVSTLLNLYSDVRRKMTQEFSAYGANVVLAPRDLAGPADTVPKTFAHVQNREILPDQPELLDEDLLGRLKPIEEQVKGLVAVPRLDMIVRVMPAGGGSQGLQSVTVVATGADFGSLRILNPAWRVEGDGSPLLQEACAVGANLALRLGLETGNRIAVDPDAASLASPMQERAENAAWPGSMHVVRSIVSTGSAEDNQVFLPLEALQELLGRDLAGVTARQVAASSRNAPGSKRRLSLVELYVPGDARQVEGRIRELARAFAGTKVEVRPVRRILYSEGRVLGTIRGVVLWLTGVILVIVALCVTATMTAIVLERRKDIAVMKALGASNRRVMLLFLLEGATLGLLAGVAGCFAGGALASQLAQRLFAVHLHWVWWAWPLVSGATVLLAIAASFSPVRSARAVEPAVVLKGG